MTNKKQVLREVRLEDFDIALLRRAAREGRLFIAPEVPAAEGRSDKNSCPAAEGRADSRPAAGSQTTDKNSRRQLVASILAYVEPIAVYSSCPRVGDIWRAVLGDPRLAPLFFFWRYSSSQGKVNWYRVTALVCLMREQGFYRQDIPAQRLHCILEGSERRTNRYTGMSRYLFEQAQLRVLREILNRFRQ